MKLRWLVLVFIYSISASAQRGSLLDPQQLFDTFHTVDGTGIINASSKYSTPLGSRVAANRLKTSYTRTQVKKNHPSGSALFRQDGNLAGLLNNFLSSVEELVGKDFQERFAQETDNYFISYFSRIQLTILHELYQYLIAIYTSFNMTHVNTLEEYIVNEHTYALNRKTMIINHLVAIIEAQANQAISMRFPNIPQHIATRMGPMMMKQDYGADLNLMIEGEELSLFDELQTQQYYQKRRQVYTVIFGKYLLLFKNYTQTLFIQDTEYGTRFARLARDIKQVINAAQPTLGSYANIQSLMNALRTIKTINPPLFFYDDETLRGLNLIPAIAQELPKNAQPIPWPDQLMKDAASGDPVTTKFGNVVSAVPRAYFVDATGKITRNGAQAARLFVNIPTAQNMYSQEVKKQPAWLNNTEGVMLMLRACLGDYSALLDPRLQQEEILDPCIRCIVINASLAAGIGGSQQEAAQACKECKSYLQQLRTLMKQTDKEELPPPPPPPDLGDLPPM